ncbi:MAG TPA: SBBP repeat-containing protein, partial [Bacteroidia bacterium]|nr:SBBP repeat-containing protein [Bacteroidia bacterium]
SKNFEWWWDNVYCVKTDSAGNVYSSGNIGYGKSFIEKYDANGISMWRHEFSHNTSSLNIFNNCPSIAIDDSGNVYGAGYFTLNTTFSTVPLVQLNTPYAVYETFVVKLNSYGDLVWVRQFKDTLGSEDNNGYSIAVDKAGNIYTTGTFTGTVDFDPDSLSVYPLSSAITGPFHNDIYILKLSSAGNFIWAKSFYNAGAWLFGDHATSIVLNDSADLFIAGGFDASNTDFDPGPGTYYLSAQGNYYSSFICRLDSSGAFKMATKFDNASLWSIDLDKSGNIYTSGSCNGTTDFDPDTSIHVLPGGGLYILRLNQNADFLSVVGLEGPGQIYSISAKDSSAIYSTGYFNDTLDFDPSIGNYILYPNVGSQYSVDAFVWKLSLCNSPMQFDSLVGCDSINVPGQTYFNSGTYLQTFINSAGCDSTIQWHLTINKSNDSLIVAQACDSIQFNGINYFASGTYQQSFTNSSGCDSTLNLQIAINKSYDSLFTVLACDSFLYNGIYLSSSGIYPYTFTTVNGCDSIINLDLTINQSATTSTSITASCGYIFNGTTLNASGIYFDTLSSIYGCDSIIILNLTINSIDTSVTQNGITLTSNATGVNYYWLNCDNNYQIISGATNQSFTPTVNGNYAVMLLIVSPITCLDTSSCYEINSVGVDEIAGDYFFSIYPNPFDDKIYVNAAGNFPSARFQMLDVLGRKVFDEPFTGGNEYSAAQLNPGVYIFRLQLSGEIKWHGAVLKK